MTYEVNWSNREIDLVKPISIFFVSKDEEVKEAFKGRSKQALLKQLHHQKEVNLIS